MGGRVRRRGVGVRSLPEVLASALPAELNMLEFCSTVEGLRFEQSRIRDWLELQCPGCGSDLLGPVLEYVGFDVAGWYRRVLSAPPDCQI
jgi:hypothetical protein